MTGTEFDDLEDGDFAPRGVASSAERAGQVRAAVEATATIANFEPCAKCRGTGSWGTYKPMRCYSCNGAGRVARGFNARSAAASKGKATAEQNARVKGMENVERFGESNPDEWAWLKAASNRGDQFAESLIGKLRQWGSLTDNQMQAVRSSMARAAERKAPVAIDVTGLDAAFAVARSKGAKRASIRTEAITFSLAKSTGQNPGAIYAKSRASGEYLGKIVGGKFTKAFACTPGDVEQIVEASRNPKAAALRYAAITGECSICGAELTDKDSIAAGIGPVCATKFGW